MYDVSSPDGAPTSPAPAADATGVVHRSQSRTGRGKRRGRTRRRHTVAKVILSSLLVLGLVAGMSVAYFYRHLNGNLNVVDTNGHIIGKRPGKFHINAPHQPLNILVLGSDSRDCSGCNVDGQTNDGARSDTTIILHLSADRTHAYAVSIPRDSMVKQPECETKKGTTVGGATMAMWNEAYSLGGDGGQYADACVQAQVEQDTGIHIDDVVDVNFAGFKGMVDAVGGVEVCVPQTWDDRAHGIYIKKGTRKISGRQALAYVRIRHIPGTDGTDLGRIKRQQAFIASMVHQVMSSSTLANPVKMLSFLDAATKSLTVSSGLKNLSRIAGIAYQFRHIAMDKITFVTVPNHYYSASEIAANPLLSGRVAWTEPDATALWDKVIHDKPLGALSNGAISVGTVPGQTQSGGASSSSSPSTSSTPSSSAGSSSGSSSPTGSPTATPTGPSASDLAKVGLCS